MCAERVQVEDTPWTVEWAAAKLGLDRARVREIRDGMTEGTDYRKTRAGVVFTQSGLDKLESAVKSALQPQNGADGNGHGPAWVTPPDVVWKPFTADPVTIVTLRRKLANPVVMEGQLDDGKIVRLRVKPSDSWRPGMRLPSVQLGEDFFEFRGTPPRTGERWR